MKKWIAALMCIALLMGLAACSQPAEQAGGSSNNENPNVPDYFGMLTVNMNAIVNVSYDEEGYVLAVSSGNETGAEVAEKLTDTLGFTCDRLVCDLIAAIADTSYAADQNTILLKQAEGSQVPNDTFLENVRAEVEKIAGDRIVILVTEDQLAEDGYLSLDSAKELLAKQLKVEASAVSGDPILQDGRYWLSVTTDNVTVNYIVDANLGVIEEQPAEPDVDPMPEVPDEGYYDPTMDMIGNDEPNFDPGVDTIGEEFSGGGEADGGDTTVAQDATETTQTAATTEATQDGETVADTTEAA